MTDNYFDVDQETSDALNQGMQMGNAIELPFNAPVFYWLNGQPAMRGLAQQAPAVYFGGWAVDQEAFESAKEEYGELKGLQIPLVDMTSKNGKDYRAYVTRNLYAAPISYRACWVLANEQTGTSSRTVQYAEGARHHVQLLALAASKTESGFAPWGPVVLSAKGFQAQ
jgi:hypothetical protein